MNHGVRLLVFVPVFSGTSNKVLSFFLAVIVYNEDVVYTEKKWKV